MDGMSDIRKAIMARLGFAAGEKAAMAMEAKYPQAFRDAMQMMQEFEDLEPTSALKQAASDLGIPEGAEMRKFVEWANKRIRASRSGAKATMGKYWVEDGQSNVKQPVKSMREGIQLVSGMQNGVLRYADHGMTSILAYGRGSGGASLTEDGKLHQKHASSRDGAKATFAFPGIVVKEDAQYIYYYPDEDDRATFADADGKGAYTVKSNRTGKPVSAKTYRSWDEAVSASNAMNEKLPPLKKRKGFARTGAKAAMGKAADALNYIRNSIANGKTVYVTAGSRTTKVTPQTYAKWEASGRPLFKLGGDGALLMASGSSYVRLTLADEMLARVTAMSKSGFAAGEKAAFANEEAKLRNLMGQLGQKPDNVIYKNGAFEMQYLGRSGKGDGEQRARRTLANLHSFMRRNGLDTHGAYYQPIDDRDPSKGGMIVLHISVFDKAKSSRPGAKAKFGEHSAFVVWQQYDGSATGSGRGFNTLQQAHDFIKQRRAYIAAHADPSDAKKVSWVISKTISPDGSSQRVETVRFSRPGAKAKMGILDRISRGLSAATAKPVDPTTPQYLSGLTAAKKAAEEAKSNYEYMADLNDARFKQLDNYVKVTSNMITKMNSSADIQRLIAGLKAAVAARVFVQSSMKTPFSRLGDKTEFAEGCGSGAGGFKPGNTCGKEDGKAGGGGAKKKKKPTSPKPATPRLTRREERRQELENIVKARQAEERARRGTESASAPKAKRAPKVSREETARAGNDAPSLRDSEDSLNEDLRKARKMRDDVMNEGNGEGVDRLDTLVSDLELAADEERRNRGDDYDFARSSRHSMMSRLDVIANRYSARSRKVNNCNVDSKPLSYGKGCETEQDKAGLKLMEKADKAVSDKIRTLIKEGEPQDQAVAIALDMKRRGEL